MKFVADYFPVKMNYRPIISHFTFVKLIIWALCEQNTAGKYLRKMLLYQQIVHIPLFTNPLPDSRSLDSVSF